MIGNETTLHKRPNETEIKKKTTIDHRSASNEKNPHRIVSYNSYIVYKTHLFMTIYKPFVD